MKEVRDAAGVGAYSRASSNLDIVEAVFHGTTGEKTTTRSCATCRGYKTGKSRENVSRYLN